MKCKFCDGSGKDYWCLNGVPYPCPVCNGTGEVQVTGDSVTDVCDKCGGTGKITKKDSVTNEEWFCDLSTEEKAKAIVCLAVNAFHKQKKETDVDKIKQWLQEEHK